MIDKKTYETINPNLPAYEEVQEFLDEMEYDKEKDTAQTFTKKLAKKIIERFETHVSTIESILNPDQTIIAMHEAMAFSEQERAQLSNELMTFMRVLSEQAIIDLESNDYEAYVQKLLIFYKEKKPVLKQLYETIRASWNPKKDLKTEIGYLG